VVWTEGTPHSERDLTWGQKQTRRWIVPRARAYLGTSSVACHNLVRQGADPASVFEAPQTHDVVWVRTEVDRLLLQRHDTTPVVLFVGFLNERKGVVPLLRAFSRVHRRVPQARLRLVGSGVLRHHLEAEAAALGILPQVDFLGFIQPSRLPEILATSDVFVLPSLEDTFGVVVVEALAAGIPVVCSPFAGVASHLENGGNAFIVDPLDTEALAERIIRLLTDRETRDVFAERGRALSEAFRPEQVAVRFHDALRAAQWTVG
jgi:glycosyltransferase involved in cell wall biosynthesis